MTLDYIYAIVSYYQKLLILKKGNCEMSKAIRSTIANNVLNGTYIRNARFRTYNEATEGILAQQKEFERKLAMIQEAKKRKVIK